MAVSSIRTPPNRFINDTRVFKFEKEKRMENPSRDQLYLERSEFMKHIGWELRGNRFYNNNLDQEADVYVVTLKDGNKVYIPISDEPAVTSAYRLHVASGGVYSEVLPNTWKTNEMLRKPSRRNRHHARRSI